MGFIREKCARHAIVITRTHVGAGFQPLPAPGAPLIFLTRPCLRPYCLWSVHNMLDGLRQGCLRPYCLWSVHNMLDGLRQGLVSGNRINDIWRTTGDTSFE
jgi:hypothetical protein